MILYVVRHGETIWNKEHRVQGITDMPLTEKGIEDIKHKYKDKNILIVTHSVVSRVIHYLLGSIPEDGDLSKINIPNLRIIEYKI